MRGIFVHDNQHRPFRRVMDCLDPSSALGVRNASDPVVSSGSMASSSESAKAETEERTFARSIIDWHWKWPIVLASALLLALLATALGIHSILGNDLMAESGRGIVGLEPHLRTDLVLALVAAFTFGACLASPAKATREFDRLRRILRLDDAKFDVYRRRLFPKARTLFIAALIGGTTGTTLVMSPYLDGTLPESNPGLHSIAFTILLFGVLGILAEITHRQSQVFREVGRQHVEVDLLDPGALTPFAAVGLMNAGFWFIGSAIASLLMASAAGMWSVVMVIVVTMGFGVAGLIVPSRGLHTQIRERKREELARIRNAIAAEREALFSSAEASPTLPRMHSMLAYEARIEAVREWPFDTSTLSRFALFLLIPLVSWIGGALVERAVDAALN